MIMNNQTAFNRLMTLAGLIDLSGLKNARVVASRATAYARQPYYSTAFAFLLLVEEWAIIISDISKTFSRRHLTCLSLTIHYAEVSLVRACYMQYVKRDIIFAILLYYYICYL